MSLCGILHHLSVSYGTVGCIAFKCATEVSRVSRSWRLRDRDTCVTLAALWRLRQLNIAITLARYWLTVARRSARCLLRPQINTRLWDASRAVTDQESWSRSIIAAHGRVVSINEGVVRSIKMSSDQRGISLSVSISCLSPSSSLPPLNLPFSLHVSPSLYFSLSLSLSLSPLSLFLSLSLSLLSLSPSSLSLGCCLKRDVPLVLVTDRGLNFTCPGSSISGPHRALKISTVLEFHSSQCNALKVLPNS